MSNAPEIVKTCYKSIVKFGGLHPIIVVDGKNFHKYADIPLDICEKLHSNIMTITHFSDILRMYLLYQHGGIWLDSTVLLTKPIDLYLNENVFLLLNMVNEVIIMYAKGNGQVFV